MGTAPSTVSPAGRRHGTGSRSPAAPSFQELSRNYVAWAGPVYTEVLGKVWTVSATAYCPPERTDPGEAPWPPADRELAAAPLPGERLWPEEAWPALWAAAQAASTPLTCVIGWRNESSARAEGATHVGAADAPPRPLPVPPLPVPQLPVPPQPASGPAGPPGRPAPSVRVPAPREVSAPQPLAAGRPPAPVRLVEPVRAPARPVSKTLWRLPIPAALGAAALVGAAVGAVITALVSGGSPAAPPAAPVTIQLVVPSAAGQAPDTLLSYRDGALSAGQSTARLAVWSGGSAASASTCAAALRATQAAAPIPASAGLRLCVELTGQPGRYGVVEVTTVSPASVTALATVWP